MAMVTWPCELYSEGHCNIVSFSIINFHFRSPLHYFFPHYAVGFPGWVLACHYFKTAFFCRLSFLMRTIFFLHSQEVYYGKKNRLQNVYFTLTARYRWGFQKYFSGEVLLTVVGEGLKLCPLENSASFRLPLQIWLLTVTTVEVGQPCLGCCPESMGTQVWLLKGDTIRNNPLITDKLFL